MTLYLLLAPSALQAPQLKIKGFELRQTSRPFETLSCVSALVPTCFLTIPRALPGITPWKESPAKARFMTEIQNLRRELETLQARARAMGKGRERDGEGQVLTRTPREIFLSPLSPSSSLTAFLSSPRSQRGNKFASDVSTDTSTDLDKVSSIDDVWTGAAGTGRARRVRGARAYLARHHRQVFI